MEGICVHAMCKGLEAKLGNLSQSHANGSLHFGLRTCRCQLHGNSTAVSEGHWLKELYLYPAVTVS